MKQTILIATDNFMPRIDGIARFLEMLIPHLKEYNVEVIAPNFKGFFEKKDDYKVHRVPMRKMYIGDFQLPKKPKDIANIVRHADLVFVQTIGPVGKAVMDEAYEQQKKIINFVHNIEWVLVEKSLPSYAIWRPLISLYAKMYTKNQYKKSTALIVPSFNVGEVFSAYGIKRPKFVVNLGIDLDEFKRSPRSKAKQALGIDPGTFVVGYVGRIAREKNLLTLKKAFKKIDAKDKKLLIVGEGIPKLHKKLTGQNTIITGKIKDVVPYLNAMDAFVMPSLTETTCLSALEAMACEVPVISTKVGSIRSYIMNRKNGLFFPKKNDTILAIRLNYIKNNPAKAKELGKAARKTVMHDYNWKKTVDKIKKIIDHQLK